MSENSFRARFIEPAKNGGHGHGEVVPLRDKVVFDALLREAAAFFCEYDVKPLRILADAATVAEIDEIRSLTPRVERFSILGPVPEALRGEAGVREERAHLEFGQGNRICAICSPQTLLIVLADENGAEEPFPFTGAWSVNPNYAAEAVQALLGGETLTNDCPRIADECHLSEFAMRLMCRHAGVLLEREQDIASDKRDLASVLSILQAISAKRSAHEILFIFVEQIARVVDTSRVSVVRLWSGDKKAQVLASHEDASLVDFTIDLSKYPEIAQAMTSQKKVVINDVATDPLTAPFAGVLQRAGISAIMVIPVVLYDENIGSLLLRGARRSGGFSQREINFFEIVAEAAANALERAHLFESIKLANQTLEKLAITDGLTGLYNHRYFRERLDQEVGRAIRYQQPLSCLILDIDNFKSFNDTYGHLVGDTILKEIAVRVGHSIRKSDLLARYGGEEFFVIMPQTPLLGAMVEAERVRAVVADTPFDAGDCDLIVTISVGVGVLDPDTMTTPEDFIKAADQAMYQAKRTGKNKVVGPDELEAIPYECD